MEQERRKRGMTMDAVKFLREYRRMCTARKRCLDCPMRDIERYTCSLSTYNDDELNKMIEIVENWSKENPEGIGKKYIVEIDRVDRDFFGHNLYHVKNADGFWFSEGSIAKLEEYKESEEK